MAHGVRSPLSVSWSSSKARHGRDSNYLPGRILHVAREASFEGRASDQSRAGFRSGRVVVDAGEWSIRTSSMPAADVLSRAGVTHKLRCARRKFPRSVWRHSVPSTEKATPASGSPAAVVVVVACSRERPPFENDAYSPPPISPAHKHVRKKP